MMDVILDQTRKLEIVKEKSGFRVLVVEDDPGLNHLILSSLNGAGFPVESAFDRDSAVASVIGNSNVLLLLDYKLGQVTAQELLDDLKVHSLNVPFIILTGQGNEEVAVKFMKLGARDYLVKDRDVFKNVPHVVQRVFNEIHHEKQLAATEASLRESQQQNQAILNLLPDLIVKFNTEGIVLCCKDSSYCALVKEKDCIGSDIRDVMPEGAGFVNFDHLKTALETRKLQIFEFLLRVEETTRLFETRMIAASEDSVLCIIRDITEIKQAEQALKESQERLRIASKTVPLIIFNMDLDLRYTWIYNPNKLDILNRMIGQTNAKLYAKKYSAKLTALKNKVLQTGKGLAEEIFIILEGREYYFYLSLEPLKDSAGNTEGLTGSALDITDRKKAELEREKLIEKLQDALKEVNQLHGMLPICSGCKKIRDDKGYWNQIEKYISEHADVEFSHGMCPECRKEYYGDL